MQDGAWQVGARRWVALAVAAATIGASGAVIAGGVEVVDIEARRTGATAGASTWTFSVSLRHDDEGWDHYADAWEVRSPDGALLGRRVLAHPHVTEQPFTRSKSGIEIPNDVATVLVRGRDLVHGYQGEPMEFTLPAE